MSDKDEYMAKLDKLQRDVDWIISYLLKMNAPIQPIQPAPYITYDTATKCSKCGMEWKGVMGYVCSDMNCPVQMKITYQTYNISNATASFEVESLDPDERSWYYDGDGTKRKKE